MRIDFSIKEQNSSNNIMGFYPIGSRHCWHGGIHLEGGSAIRAICDGVVVAYRLPEDYTGIKEEGGKQEYVKKYSNGFVLIQHHYKTPTGQELRFYSLYHHLLPKKEYDSKTLPVPFRKRVGYKALKGNKTKTGLEMWTGNKRGGECILIPTGGVVKKEAVEGDNFTPAKNYCRVIYKVKNEKLIGHLWVGGVTPSGIVKHTGDTKELKTDADNKYKCFGVEVWKDKGKKVLLDIVDPGTVFNEGEEDGKFIRVKLGSPKNYLVEPDKGCGYIEKKYLQENIEWDAETGRVINCKIPVKAGDIIGYCALYAVQNRESYRVSHLEVFTDDEKNLEDFLKNARKDGMEGNEISNAYVKLSGKLKQSFSYKLLANTDITKVDEKGDYYKIRIGDSEQVVCTNPECKELVKNDNVKYQSQKKGPVAGRYLVLKDITNTHVFGGILKAGDFLDYLETESQAVENDRLKPKECPRRVRYSYPVSGQEFWVKKSCITDKTVVLSPCIEGVPQIRFPGLDQSDPGTIPSYALKSSGAGGNTVLDIDLYPGYPGNTDSEEIKGEIIFPLRDCKVFVQNKEQKWYYIRNKAYEDPHGTSCTVSGVIDSGGMDIFPAYHWEKFGFSLLKQDKEKDTYVFDFDSATPLVKEVWSLVDEDGDKKLTDEEFRHAAHNKYKTDRLSKLICYHRSEWSYNDAQAWAQLEADLKSRFDKQIQKLKDSAKKAEKEKERDDKLAAFKDKVENLCFWNEIKIDTSVDKEGDIPLSPFPVSPYVYHINPVAFVRQMEDIESLLVNTYNIYLDTKKIEFYDSNPETNIYCYNVYNKSELIQTYNLVQDVNGEKKFLRFPESGVNWDRYGVRDKGGDNWINQNVAACFLGFLHELYIKYPNEIIYYDDISGYEGKNIGHKSHRKGEDIDIRYPGTSKSVRFWYESTLYDKENKDDSKLIEMLENILDIASKWNFTKNFAYKSDIMNAVHAIDHEHHYHLGCRNYEIE